MDRTRPFEVIAGRFGVSHESAKYFLGQVQKRFKKERPSHKLIVAYMSGRKFEFLPEPHDVAVMMHADGVWVHPMRAAPPASIDEEDLYF
ncbi:MAG: hypothetical protein JXB85_04475 [Anaerolineales bacterium]|nr:hypothetical protein [Anaerolineales bacterium]